MLASIASGCSYKVPTDVSPAVNIYSSYGDKIPGKFYLVLEDNLSNVHREISPNSNVCSAHDFPITVGSAFTNSVHETVQNIFSEVVLLNTMPTPEYFRQHGGTGVILVGLNRFEPRIRFIQGFWSNAAIANSDLVFEVTVKDQNGNTVLNTTAGGSRTSEGEAGSFCSNGSDLLSQNLHDSTREAMERLAERLANSQKIRELADQIAPEKPTTPKALPPAPVQPVASNSPSQPTEPKGCFEGVSDNYPDNDSINIAEALSAAKCAAIKAHNPDYDCPNNVSVDHEFEQIFGDNYEMKIGKKTKDKVWIKICISQ